MYKRHSSFYYIFWIVAPMFIGGSLAWGTLEGAKTTYVNFFDKEKIYVVDSSSQKASSGEEISSSAVLAEKGSEDPSGAEGIAPPIDDLRYTFIDSKTVASAKENTLLQKIENSLPEKHDLKVTALAFVAADLDSGEILLEKSPNAIFPIASVTKLITAYVSLHALKQDTIISIPKSAVDTYGESGKLKVGEKIAVADLLYPLLLESSNDAAEALAGSKDRPAFIDAMNSAAISMMATHTTFLDASGLSPRNTSTANDLFKIAQFIYKKEKTIFDITKKSSYTTKTHTWVNPTLFLKSESFLGGKNGFTDEAERTTVSLWNIPQKNGPSRNVVVVVLKSQDRNKDVASIVNFLSESIQFPELTAPNSGETEMEFY